MRIFRKNRKSRHRKWTFKPIILKCCAWILVALGIVFAQQMGELAFVGVATTEEYEILGIEPVFQPGQGNVAVYNTANFPAGVNKLSTQTTEWDGTKVTLYLQKPSTASGSTCWTGNPDLEFSFTNVSTFQFTNGGVSVDNFSGGQWTSTANISASLNKTTVDAGSTFTVGIDICTAININTTDYAKITATFNVLGESKSVDIEVYFVPDLFVFIQYSPAGSGWTNQNVIATLSYTNPNIRVCAAANTNYNQCTAPSTYAFTANGTYTFYYFDNVTRDTAIATVNWIDKTYPTFAAQSIIQTGYTTLTVGVTGAGDTGGSGLEGCRYSVDNGATWLPTVTNTQACTSYQLTGLEMEHAYAVDFRVYDNAGNYTQSAGSSFATTLMLTGLPLAIDPNAQGYYFNLGTLSNKLTGSVPLTSLWNGETFTFVLMKPTATVNGNEVFSFTSTPITNIGDIAWTGGSITGSVVSTGIDPIGGKTTLTINPTTVNPGGTMNFTFNLNGKIDINDIDFVQATITYSIENITPNPNFKVLFYYIPANGYGFNYDANGGSGKMSGSTCAAYNAACVWDANRQTGIRANGFTPPIGKTAFVGWNTKADGTGTSYAPNASVPANTFASKSVNTLYAIWQ